MWGDSCPMSQVTREPTAESRPVLPDAAACAGDENAGRAPRVVGVPSRSFRGDTCLADALHRLVRVGEALGSLLSDGSEQRESVARSGWDPDAPSRAGFRARGQPGGLAGHSAERPFLQLGLGGAEDSRRPLTPPRRGRLRGVFPCVSPRAPRGRWPCRLCLPSPPTNSRHPATLPVTASPGRGVGRGGGDGEPGPRNRVSRPSPPSRSALTSRNPGNSFSMSTRRSSFVK